MAFLVSPGVNTSEIDLTNVVVAAGTSTGGFAGRFRWGPIEEVTLITDEDNLVEVFQKPNDDNFEQFFTVANFLTYSGAINVVRAANTTVTSAASPKNATANTATYVDVQIKTSDDYYDSYDPAFGGTNATSLVASTAAKWAGDLGNTFKISWCPADAPAMQGASTVTGGTGTMAWTSSGGVIAGAGGSVFGKEIRVGDIVDINGASGGIVITAVTADDAATGTPLSGTIGNITATTWGKRARSTFSQPQAEMAGTVATTAESKTVTGTATVFSAQFCVNDLIIVGGESRRVTAISSDTEITVKDKFIGVNSTASYERKWEYAGAFSDGPPTTSVYAEDKSLATDEVHVAIVDEDGNWSGQLDEVLEAHANLSVIKGAKSADGENIYYADYLNNNSDFVWWLDHPIFNVPISSGTDATETVDTGGGVTVASPSGGTAGTFHGWGITAAAALAQTITGGGGGTQNAFIMPTSALSTSFQGGTDGNAAPSNGDFIRGYDMFKSAEDVDVSLIPTGSHSSTVVRHVVQNIAEYRKDCVAFFSPQSSDVIGGAVTNSSVATDNVVDYRDTVNMNSSYAVMDSGWKYQYDKHNDKFRFVPLNGDIAGLCARTDADRDPFFSPGGFTRGQIKGVVKLPFNPKLAERDKLYAAQINPVVAFPGEGTVLYGDKTQLTKPSAFDRINVRRLFILLEKAIANAARFQLFEFNDEFTRSQFVSMVEPFLRDIQGRGGITDFRVICDSSNNTAQVVDSNQFRGDIFIKPSRAINFIQLNFVAVRSGVEFSEVVGAV